MKAIAGKLSLSLLGLLLSFLLLEAILRFFSLSGTPDHRKRFQQILSYRNFPTEIYQADYATKYRLKPNTSGRFITVDYDVIYTINSKGLRDREFLNKPMPNRKRVLFLGDSFTFGEGVEMGKRFSDIVQNQLPDLEIINAGVPGWGLDQEITYLALEGIQWKPHVVVLFLNQTGTERILPGVVNGDAVRLPSTMAPALSTQDTTYLGRKDMPIATHFAHSEFLSLLGISWWRLNYDQHSVPNVYQSSRENQSKHRTQLLLQEFLTLSKKSKTRPILINIDPIYPLSYAGNLGLPFFSLQKDLQTQEIQGDLRFTYDPHFSPKTHALIGEKVAAILKQEKLR